MHQAASEATVSPDGVVHLFPNVEVEALCGDDREPPPWSSELAIWEEMECSLEVLCQLYWAGILYLYMVW